MTEMTSISGKVYDQQPDSQLGKIQFKQSQVSFYDHWWSKCGISPDPKKIQALNHMECPPDKETMRSFLGMINYLNRYSALSAHLTTPLSALTHQATDYKPGKVHFENFNRLKLEISNMKALPFFDVNAETALQMDTSKKGLRACLIQKRTVKGFTLETDQKPLVSIYKKHMVDISPRVQRLIVSSFPYLPFKVVYKKGTDIPVADALSCVTPMDLEDNIQLPFWPHKEMLSTESGLITCGNRIKVPKEMRPEMLQYVHKGHQGKERCLLRARNTVFWPKMTYDVQQLIEKCIIWQKYGKSNQS